MKTFLAIQAYGLLLVSSFFLAFLWGRIAYRQIRMHEQTCWQARKDPYAVISSSLLMSSIGTGIFFGSRAYQTMELGISSVAPNGATSIIILVGLYTLAISKAGFVWTIHCTGKSWVWISFLIASAIWACIASLWVGWLVY